MNHSRKDKRCTERRNRRLRESVFRQNASQRKTCSCLKSARAVRRCATHATLTPSLYRTDLECTDNMCGMTRRANGLRSVWAESCVPTGLLDDFIVSLVTDSRRLRKGSTGSDAWGRLRRRRSSRSIRVELQQELAQRCERKVLKFKEQRLRERFGEGNRT